MLLYPDPRIGGQPDNLTTCFTPPIDRCDWEHLWGMAVGSLNFDGLNGMRFVLLDEGIYFLRSNGEDGYDQVVIMLRHGEDEDTCLESAAWIRVKYEYNGMIYICRRSMSDHLDWQTALAVTAHGVDESLVAMIDLYTDYSEEDQP